MQAKPVQLMRNREDDVIMLHRKGSQHQVIDPKRLFSSLTFGTVRERIPRVAKALGAYAKASAIACGGASYSAEALPVATAVVTVADGSTAVAYFFMPAQGRSTATDDLREYLLLQGC